MTQTFLLFFRKGLGGGYDVGFFFFSFARGLGADMMKFLFSFTFFCREGGDNGAEII